MPERSEEPTRDSELPQAAKKELADILRVALWIPAFAGMTGLGMSDWQYPPKTNGCCMIDAQFTYFDAAVLGIMAFSCLFAFFRGFVKEVLSLGAWIGAGIITVYFLKDVTKLVSPHIKDETVAGGVSALGLYITCLLGFSIINSLISRMMKEGSDIGFLDNMLGLFFGAFRGAFIISLAYFMMMFAISDNNAPDWLANAHTKPYAEKGAILLGRAAPEYLAEMTSFKDKIAEKSEDGSTRVKLFNTEENSEGGETDLGQFLNNLKKE